MKKKLYIIINNHMDLLWRRCFERRFEDNGRTYVSYADLQGWYIDDNLALCEKHAQYKFQIESPAVLQAYLRRRPEQKPLLQRLYREKRIWTGATGENIVDGNLSGGESIVRNFVMGQLYMQEHFGAMPTLANRDDAFGNCAQLPQILRGCGLRWVKGLSYSTPPADYWRGLDGSMVYTGLLPVGGMGGGWRKYAPCPVCGGSGRQKDGTACAYCDGRGIDRPKNEPDRQPITLQDNLPQHSVVMVGGEEILPNEDVLRWMAELDASKYEAAFACEEDAYALLAEEIACDAPPESRVHTGELNPNNTGVYLTRIGIKQRARQIEDALLRLEMLYTMVWGGKTPYPKAALDALWRDHFLTLFHDGIAATLIDAAAAELDDLQAGIIRQEHALRAAALAALAPPNPAENGADGWTLVNHTGFSYTGPCVLTLPPEQQAPGAFACGEAQLPVMDVRPMPDGGQAATVFVPELPAFGMLHLSAAAGEAGPLVEDVIEPLHPGGIQAGILRADERNDAMGAGASASYSIENERYLLKLNTTGPAEVWDKALGRAVAGLPGQPALSLCLESDIGSPWATVLPGRERLDLAPYTYLHKLERHPGFERACYQVDLPQTLYGAINSIRIGYTLTLYTGAQQVDVQLDADWDTYNTRLVLAVHTAARGRHLYEIPYGFVERAPYEPVYRWTGANGDWPAQNWAGVSGDWSLAVLNRGLPAHRITENGDGIDIEVSLLRSPTMPTYLHEPDAYSMLALDGMRDTGSHSFQLALAAYGSPLEQSAVTAAAKNFNTTLCAAPGRLASPSVPVLASDCAYIACQKRAENGDALVLRLAEYRGIGGSCRLTLPQGYRRVEKTDMLERPQETFAIYSGVVELSVCPFEIATLKLVPN